MPPTVVETAKFFCVLCKVHAQLIKEGGYRDDDPDEAEHGYARSYFFGHCARCDAPGLLEVAKSSDNRVSYRQLYPLLPYEITLRLPSLVDRSYREAVKCAFNGTWMAAMVMVRRTLEAMGKEFDPASKSAFQGLKKMKDQGMISEELYQWGDQLRKRGNLFAHATEQEITEQDGEEAMSSSGAIIETLYDLRPKFKAMQERHSNTPPGSDAESPED